MEYVLTTEALCKQYKKSKALDELCMHIPKGAIYGFVGKNGAGKTTLIRMICGLSKPTAGSYTLYETDSEAKEIVTVRKNIGAVVETPALSLDMTAEENMRQQYRILGLSSFDGIKELLALVGLENTGKKKVKAFSLGMKQRLGIAMALAGEPDFLVLDEPTNGLDPQGIIELRELILKLNHEKGITFLISSHILDELSRIATHYGIINHGKMIKEFSAQELEKECGKYINIRAEISDADALTRALDDLGIRYEIISEKEKSLENYFISLVGGEDNA
ncbi:MAG: ATP-binding cassette domain-containing protein [Lachnospiraceae bacterium]|nr:ATP-binding cassette domain-containing protein [Lachnospiraceae bacterium]